MYICMYERYHARVWGGRASEAGGDLLLQALFEKAKMRLRRGSHIRGFVTLYDLIYLFFFLTIIGERSNNGQVVRHHSCSSNEPFFPVNSA